MKFIHVIIILFLLPAALFAFDFGIVANVNTGLGGQEEGETVFDFSANIMSRLFMLVGDNGELVATTGLSLGVLHVDFFFVPEILHTELTMRFGASGIRVGRMNYSDPLSFIATGLFDGVQYFHNGPFGSFNIGAWYTGLLYKKNARIMMTSDEQATFVQPIDYEDFFDTYFAPKRVITALGWEHPSFGNFMHFSPAVVAQFDLSGDYHSQYLIMKAAIPISNLRLEVGSAVELSQGDEFNMAFAGMFGLYWLFPGEFNKQLSFTARIAGGGINDFIHPFVPITTKFYGFSIKHKMSGLSVLSLDYSARLHQTFSVSAGVLYFVRNDKGTFHGYPLAADSDGFFLGPEIYTGMKWSPFSDFQINFGGGIFFPSYGDAGKEEPASWKAELSAVLALY